MPGDVDRQHLDPHHVAGLDHRARVGDEGLRHGGHVHQAVLVHADVDERAERGHVGHHALQHHAGPEVPEGLDALGERRGDERGPRVTAGFLQLAHNVGDGGQAEPVVGERLRLQRAERGGAADQGGRAGAGGGHDAADDRVGLGVHAGRVQRVVAAADTQEPGALLEGLGAETGHLHQLLAGPEGPLGVAAGHDRGGQAGGDAGDPGQQRLGGGVQVDADRVHAVLDHGVQRVRQLALGDVMLVLADADGLRVDLDQLGQGVLEPAGDGYGTAQRDVKLREFGRGVGGRRVNAGAGLRDHDLGQLELGVPLDQVRGQPVGLPRGGAVADGDELRVVLMREPGQGIEGFVPLTVRLVRVDGRGRGHLAGPVGHRDLDPGPEAGIQADRGPGARRGGQQQVPQVGREHPDRLVLGRLPQPDPDVDAEVGQDAGAPGPVHGGLEPGVRGAAFAADAEAIGDGVFDRRVVGPGVEGEVEDLLLLAAEQGQDAVRGQPGERFAELEVIGELRAFLFFARADPGDQRAAGGHRLAQRPDQVGVLGEPLDQDRAGALQRGGRVGDVLVDEGLRFVLRVVARISEQQVGQRLQARLPGDLGLGAALGLVRQVQVLQPRLGIGGPDLGLELAGQLALGRDFLADRLPALVELTQVAQPLLERTQLRVVERAGGFLAVPGDERHGGAAVEQFHRRADLPDGHAELTGDPLVHRPGLILRHQSNCASEPGARDPGRSPVPGEAPGATRM